MCVKVGFEVDQDALQGNDGVDSRSLRCRVDIDIFDVGIKLCLLRALTLHSFSFATRALAKAADVWGLRRLARALPFAPMWVSDRLEDGFGPAERMLEVGLVALGSTLIGRLGRAFAHQRSRGGPRGKLVDRLLIGALAAD